MATLHLFGGVKGGTGKSFVTRTAAQYHLDRGLDFSLFDGGNSVADVKRTYHSIGCRSVIFSEDRKRQDEPNCLYSAAKEKTTLVNLPPQVSFALRGWFERNNIVNRAKEDGVNITYWFVCNGEPSSVRLADQHLSYFRNSVNHVLVINLMHGYSREDIQGNQSLQQQIKEYKVKVLDFPQFLGRSFLDNIIREGLTFGEAREYEGFHFLDRSQLTVALKEAHQEFDNANVFTQGDVA